MIDQTSQFFAILTNIGTAKQANADALGIAWKITQMGVGDANGTDPIPSAAQTRLINERRRAPLNQLKVDPANSAIIIAEQVIPEDVGGWWIREIGLYDADGDLVAIANCAPSFKPLLTQGSGRTQVVRMNMIVSNSSNVELKIDPSVVLATRAYVDAKVLEELNKLDDKQSVLVATTANIALAGLQTIDGVAVPAGARVLVKNQTVAKDNGIYLAAAPVWTRAPDADSNAEVTSALLVSVEQGATLADTRWQLVTDAVIVLGTTALTFQNVTQGFAPINSPAFLGTPTVPTPAPFDSSKLVVNSEFVQRALGNHNTVAILSAAAALTAAHCGSAIRLTGSGYTVTLPAMGPAAPYGAKIVLRNEGGGNITIAAPGADKIVAASGLVSSLVMGVWDSVELVVIGGVWAVTGGSLALASASFMTGPNWFTQPQFTVDKSFATTEFVQRALGSWRGHRSVSATAGLGAVDIGMLLLAVTTGITLTLPDPANVPLGATISIQAAAGASYVYVVNPAGNFGGSNGTVGGSNLVRLSSGVMSEFVCNGTGWMAIGGSGTSLAGTSGFIKHPNGLIEQWVTGSCDANGVMTVTLPTLFHERVDGGIAGEGNPTGWAATTTTSWGFDIINTTLSVAVARCRQIGTGGPSLASGSAGRIKVWGR